MKSSRQTIEQIDKLAKMFQGVLDLASDHADYEQLSRSLTDVNRDLENKRAELGKVDARLAEVKKAEDDIATAKVKAVQDIEAIIHKAHEDAAGILDEANKAGDAIRDRAREEGKNLKAPHVKERDGLVEEIKTKRGILAEIESNIETAGKTHRELQGHISTANAQIANLVKLTTPQKG